MDQLEFGDYSKRKSLFFSLHSKEKKLLVNECIARRQAGFDVELLAQEELKRNYGLSAKWGLLSQKGAANNAYLLTHELLQHSISKGLSVFDRTRIKTIDHRNKKIILKTENDCVLACDFVINASGYEVINFIGKKIVDLDCTYAIISESMTRNNEMNENGIMMWSTDHPYLYLCPTSDDRIIIGGRDESFVNMKTMHNYVDKKSILLEKDFKKCFPSISFKKEFAWSGVFGKTKDALPYIGQQPERSRVFYALGFGGNGITFSVIAAEIITDLLLGKKNKDAEIFSFKR
jgi:glycine/D-amino acid oxidase-like deaminating enzyme